MKQLDLLSKVKVFNTTNTVCLGSLVYTTEATYFIAVSIGEVQINNQFFFAISPMTPMGNLLKGKHVGDTISFNDKAIHIEEII